MKLNNGIREIARYAQTIACVAVLSITVLASCQNPVGNDGQNPSAAVTITLAGADGAIRSIMPSAPNFSRYTLTLQKGEAIQTPDTSGLATGSVTVQLEPGEWSVTVDAFQLLNHDGSTAQEYKVATAVTTFTVVADGRNSIVVQLEPIAEDAANAPNGVFAWDITLPNGVNSATLSLETVSDLTGLDLTLNENRFGSTEVSRGIYNLTIILGKDGFSTSQIEKVYIYSGLQTTAALDLRGIVFGAEVLIAGSLTVTREGAPESGYVVNAYATLADANNNSNPIATATSTSGEFLLGIPAGAYNALEAGTASGKKVYLRAAHSSFEISEDSVRTVDNLPPSGVADVSVRDVDRDVFIVDISQETDWNYMVVGTDGSSMFFNADESTGIPTLLYLKPEKDSDVGFTYLFKENGLLDKIIANGHVLYFGNYNGYKFDMAIIDPNGAIEYHYDIETDVNWDAYDEISPSVQARNIFAGTFTWSDGFGILSCAGAFFFHPLVVGCGSWVVKGLSDIVIDAILPVDQAEVVRHVKDTIIDVFGCAMGVDLFHNPNGSCVSAIANAAKFLTYVDLDLTEEKFAQINETIRVIDGDALTTTIPTDLLEDLLQLGIKVNHGNNPPNIEGTYFVSPDILIRSNFYDSYSPGYQFVDMQLTFSNQDNAKMTVDVDFIEGSSISSGINSFITGDGMKFSVFSEMIRTTDGARTVRIYSGEITSSGIRNFYQALIITVEGSNTIRRGQGRLVYDGDGFSEKTAAGRSLVIPESRSVLPSNELLPATSSRH